MFFFEILPFLALPLLVVGLIIYGITRLVRGRLGKASVPGSLRIAYSHEDFLGQAYSIVGFFSLWVALLAIDRQMGNPLSAYTVLLLVSLFGLAFAYMRRVLLLLPLSLVGLVSWWVLQAEEWGKAVGVKSVTYFSLLLFAALIFYALSFLQKKKFGFERAYFVYTILGLVGGTSVLFYLSTESGVRGLESMTAGSAAFVSWPIMLSIIIALASFISILVYSVGEGYLSLRRAAFIGVLAVLPAVLLGMPQLDLVSGTSYYSAPLFASLTTQGVWWYLITNALLFSEVVALILSGYEEHETWRVNLGTLFLFIFMVIKYFDFFSLLDRSGFFIGAGLILSVMGFFMERGRKKMISTIAPQS